MSDPRRVPDRYAQLVLAFEHSLASLRKLFKNMQVALGADGGFIGHEDLEGNLRLVLSKGKYFHLSSGAGFTGVVFKTGLASICDLHSPVVERPSQSVTAEMGAPLTADGRTIGVVVMDRYTGEAFTRHDLAHLGLYAEQIDGLISSSDAAIEDANATDLASLLANGKLAFEEGRYGSAERLIRGVLGIENQNVAALYLLGEIYLQTRRYEAARRTFERVLTLEPALSRAVQHLAALSDLNLPEKGKNE